MRKDIVEDSIKCLANMEIKETTYQVARNVVLDEIERLNTIINESRRILGKYKHFSTPTEEQNSENEDIVDKAYLTLHENLRK